MNKENLIEKGYIEIDNNTYEKLDKETGMKARLIFNSHANIQDNKKIEDRIINIIVS